MMQKRVSAGYGCRSLAVVALVAVFSGAWAGEATVGASGGYLTITNKDTGQSSAPLGSIEKASVELFAFTTFQPPSLVSSQDKFAPGPTGRTFQPVSEESGTNDSTAIAISEGGSTATGPYGYDAKWTNTSLASGTQASSDSGTYDPYPVSQADLQAIEAGNTIDVYFQTSLAQGSSLNFSHRLGEEGFFIHDAYLLTRDNRFDFFNILAFQDLDGDREVQVNGDEVPGLELYVLDPTLATNPNYTPAQRIGNSQPTSREGIRTLLLNDLRPDGDLDQTYYFGALLKNFTVPGDPIPGGDTLFSLHSESQARAFAAAPVPEPATALILLPGLLLMRRRRKA